jgi:hypothetical protein
MSDVPYIELNFRPNVALVAVVRRFVSEFYTRIVGDDDAVSRIALATHELLENAVRYASDGETRLRIEVDGAATGRRVHIRLCNHADPQHISAMREIVDALHATDDPKTYYNDLLKKAAKRLAGSGLGLARVAVESEMQLRYTIEQDRVTVDGTAQLT